MYNFSKKNKRNNRSSKKGGASHPEIPRPPQEHPRDGHGDGDGDHQVDGTEENSSSIIINPKPVIPRQPIVPPQLPRIAPFDPHMAIERFRPFFDIVDRGLRLTRRNPEQYDSPAVPFHDENAQKMNQLLEILGMDPDVYHELTHRYNNNDNDIIEDYLNFHEEIQKRIFIEAQRGNTFVQEFVKQADQLTLQKASEGNLLGLYHLRGDMMGKLLDRVHSGDQWASEFIKQPHVAEFINGIAQDGNTWANEFIHHVNNPQKTWVDEFNPQNAWVDEFNPQNAWADEFTQGAPPSTPHRWNREINPGRQLFRESMSQLYGNMAREHHVKNHEKEIERQKEQKNIEKQKEIENQKDQDEAKYYFHRKCILILNGILSKATKDSYKKFNLNGLPTTSIPRMRHINDPGFIEAEYDDLIQSQKQDKSAIQEAMDEMITGYSNIGVSLNIEEIQQILEIYTRKLNEIHKNIINDRAESNEETKRLKKLHDTKIKTIQTNLSHHNLSEHQLKEIENAYWEGLQKNPEGVSTPPTQQSSTPPIPPIRSSSRPKCMNQSCSNHVNFSGDLCAGCLGPGPVDENVYKYYLSKQEQN